MLSVTDLFKILFKCVFAAKYRTGVINFEQVYSSAIAERPRCRVS